MIVNKKLLKLKYKSYLLEISYFMHLGDTTTILFLHGLGDSKESFLGAIGDDKINKHTLISFDFPGHGESKYITKFDINDMVQITHLVIAALKIKDFILVGHSMGGLVGLLYLKNDSNSVKAFINVEGNLTQDDCGFSGYIASLDYKAFKKEFGNNNTMFDLSPSMIEYSKSGDLINLFISLHLPKIFIYGEESKIPYLTKLEDENIKTIKISTSGHHPFNQNPIEFYGIIEHFIENIKL